MHMMSDIRSYSMRACKSLTSYEARFIDSHLEPKECVRQMVEAIEGFLAPPRGKFEWLAETLRDLGQRQIRCLSANYMRGQTPPTPEFLRGCIKFVSLLVGQAFLRVLQNASEEPMRQRAYCSLWLDMRQYEIDSMMYAGTEPHFFAFMWPHKRGVIEAVSMKILHSGQAFLEDLPHYWEVIHESHLRLELLPLVEVVAEC